MAKFPYEKEMTQIMIIADGINKLFAGHDPTVARGALIFTNISLAKACGQTKRATISQAIDDLEELWECIDKPILGVTKR